MKEDIVKYQFKKGQSGNPKGYPKGRKNVSTIIREILDMTAPKHLQVLAEKFGYKGYNKISMRQIVYLSTIDKLIETGDSQRFRVIAEYDDGHKLPQQIEADINMKIDLAGRIDRFDKKIKAIRQDSNKTAGLL